MVLWPDWAHVQFSTRGAWLPGDERGFRDHGHRVHSSGDYKQPPPGDEHAGLRAFARNTSQPIIPLTWDEADRVSIAIEDKLASMGIAWRAMAVGPTNVTSC